MGNEKRTVLRRVARALERRYGTRQEVRDDCQEPLDELVATILSQNTTGANATRAYEAMRTAFPTWAAVLAAPRARLERVLRPAGLARTRSARIQRLLRSIRRDRGRLDLEHLRNMTTPQAERELLQFEGVGPKTANCVLLFALHRDVFPIDTHIHRILSRLAVIPAGMPVEKAHAHVAPLVPERSHLALHLNLIDHGRHVCRPTRPDCGTCILHRWCAYEKKQHRQVEP